MPARRSPQYQFQPYRSRRGNSGVTRYALGPDYTVIEFRSGEAYRYDHRAPGRKKVNTLKQLAAAGAGLATFITREVRGAYAAKLE